MKTESRNTMVIADRDNDLLNSLSLFFSDNFNVFTVYDYQRLKAHLREAQIILIEANILEEIGINILRAVKDQFPKIRIVVMGSAWTRNEAKEEFVKHNADAIVYKPFDVGRISRIISQLKLNDLTPESTG